VSSAAVTKAVDIDFGVTAFQVASGRTAFSVSSLYARIGGGQFWGDRSVDQNVAYVTGYRITIRDMRCEQMYYCVNVNVGVPGLSYRTRIDNLQARNIKEAVIWFFDGVGLDVSNSGSHTDGPRTCSNFGSIAGYKAGTSYTAGQCVTHGGFTFKAADATMGNTPPSAEGGSTDVWSPIFDPPKRCIWIQSEGSFINNTDCIDSGSIAALDYDARAGRSIEWAKAAGSYMDSSTGGCGVRLNNTESGRYIRGVSMSNMWSATGKIGVCVTGTEPIEGLNWVGGDIHNNVDEAIRVDNPRAADILFKGVVGAGNNAGGGAKPAIYSNTAGRVTCQLCDFGRLYQWTTTVPYYVQTGKSQTGDVDVSGSDFDDGGYSSAPFLKGGSGAIRFKGVSGITTHARGKATIPPGKTSMSVAPGLSVPWADEHVMISPATGVWGWTDGLTDKPGTRSFTIRIDGAKTFDASFIWDVGVDAL